MLISYGWDIFFDSAFTLVGVGGLIFLQKKSKDSRVQVSNQVMKTKMKIMTSRAWIGLLVVVLTLALQLSGHATSYADPKSETIESANGKYTLITDPKTKNHKVYSSDNLKEPLWSFKRHIWHDEFFLSNDGQRVLWVAWEYVQVDDGKGWRNREADEAQQVEASVVYSPDGVLVRKTFAEVSNPVKPIGPGPIGDFWRVWRGEKITQKDDVISIAVEGKNEDFKIDLSQIKKKQEAE